MSIEILDFAEPFFTVKHLAGVKEYGVDDKSIIINVSEQPIRIQDQALGFLQSVVVVNTVLRGIQAAVLVEDFARHADDQLLFEEVRQSWPLAYDVRKEQRLKGVSHYMSPKSSVGNVHLSMYHCGSVPLNVGLHKTHPHCPSEEFKEVHTQIAGLGKMQQCLEKDINTLYLEEPMAPGATHKPMYDQHGNYPWHQYETITQGILMAIELYPTPSAQPI